MTQEDQTEQGLSSFAREIEEVKSMIASLGTSCLLLFDEFGKRLVTRVAVTRSTSVECGMALSW